MFKQTVSKARTIVTSQLFTVKELTIEVAPGLVKKHHTVFRDDTVSVFPVTPENEVYLVRQYRYIFKKITLEAMSGFIDTGETPLVAAKRELREETGLVATNWKKLTSYHIAASVVATTNHLYLAWDIEHGDQNLMDDEDIEVVKMPIAEAVAKVLSGEINHASSIIGILMVEKILKNIH